MKANAAKYDIVIVGGGMVGTLQACTLGGSALKVAVIEQTPPPPPTDEYDLRVSAITLASQRIFEAAGAWAGMTARRVSPMSQMRVWDAAGTGLINFDSAEIGEACLGYIIENGVILSALQESLQRFTNIHYLCPAEITGIDLDGADAELTLKDGRRLCARLLIGADGAHSQVRRAAGIATQDLNLRQQGIVASVKTERPHEQTAWQRFLKTGPLAFLPFADRHHSSIVWSADETRAAELLAANDEAFIAELQEAFGDALGKILGVSRRAAFPLVLSHARAYTASRVALIGDAAHVVHPLAGQGANLGFMDAAALAEVLLQAREKQKDLGSEAVVRRYERWRKTDNLAMVAVTGGFKYLFGNNLPGVTVLRNLGLDITNTVTPLKHIIMRRATGLQGDLPKMARRTGEQRKSATAANTA